MKKLKSFYKNNRIYCILMIISLMCLIAIGVGVITYFINQARSDNYGNRLEGIETYDVSDDLEKIKEYFSKDKNVLDSEIRLQGKIIYATIEVNKDLKNTEIESLATKSLDNLSEGNNNFYDMQFIFTRDGLTPYMGSKPAGKSVISWINYSYETEGESK